MNSLTEFLEMGGYAGFVWPSYLAVALVLTVLTYLSIRSLRVAEADLDALERPDQQADQQTNDGAAEP